MTHLNIHVAGRVQGVFFRASAQDTAEALGLKGFVRNEPDGTVYIEAEGPSEKMEQFLAWCRKGPPRSVVESVVMEEGLVKNFTVFEISRCKEPYLLSA